MDPIVSFDIIDHSLIFKIFFSYSYVRTCTYICSYVYGETVLTVWMSAVAYATLWGLGLRLLCTPEFYPLCSNYAP